jgi:uracil-DNA glycosylase
MTEHAADARRRHYLRAMQVDVWRSRGGSAGGGSAAEQMPEALPSGAVAPAPVAAMPFHELEATVSVCQRCELHRGRTRTVFGTGDAQARCMIIGEAPGADEDARGEPFVGRAGQLLNAMLRAMGFSRESVYIANIVKCRPPKNRDPKPEEMVACAPFLRRQIVLIAPALILAVGRVAAQHLAGSTLPIGRMRGQSYFYESSDDGRRIPIVVTYHPAYLLRSPIEKRKSWEDLKRARLLLESAQ